MFLFQGGEGVAIMSLREADLEQASELYPIPMQSQKVLRSLFPRLLAEDAREALQLFRRSLPSRGQSSAMLCSGV